jgi:Ulp1 family protease
MIKGRTDSLAERVAEVFSTSQAVSLPIDRQADESVTLYSEDYQSLLPNRWLRTQAVDILIKLLLQREREEMSKIHASKSEFGSAASRLLVRTMDAFVVTLIMTDQEDYILESLEPLQLFSPATKYLLIPLNTEYCSGNHWLLGLLIREDHDYTLLVFDSGPGSSIGLDLCKRLQLLHRVLTKSEMQITLVLAENIPFQSNGFDCGIYTVGYAEYILKEIVNGLEENSSSLSFDSFNSKYKYLLANSTHSRERYREMLEQQILKAAATG